MTINDLMECFVEAQSCNAKHIGVKIKMADFEGYDVIISPREDFQKKMIYYIKNYDWDLKLRNSQDNAKIVGCAYGNSFSKIEDRLAPLK